MLKEDQTVGQLAAKYQITAKSIQNWKKQLLEDGFSIGKDRVLKYMQLLGINAIYPRKKKITSIKDEQHHIYKYLLKEYWKQNSRTKIVNVPNANEVWSGDITYIRTNGGFMYLAAVIFQTTLRDSTSFHDWHSKAILSYKISNSRDSTLATDVLKDALAKYILSQRYSIQIKDHSIQAMSIPKFLKIITYKYQ